jgi:hypothetical protein
MTGSHATKEDMLGRLSFPVFGLPPSWDGDRWLGADKVGVGGPRGDEILALQLGHGWRDLMALRCLSVRSTVPDPCADRYTPRVVGRDPMDQAIYELRHRWGLPVPEGYVLPAESPLTILVDGEPTRFSAIFSEEWWMALHVASNVSIRVIAKRFEMEAEDVELVTITDFHRYLEDLRGWEPKP